MIKLNQDLPELVEFTLEGGEKINIRHLGNRLEVSLQGGSYAILVHPKSGNRLEILPAGANTALILSSVFKEVI